MHVGPVCVRLQRQTAHTLESPLTCTPTDDVLQINKCLTVAFYFQLRDRCPICDRGNAIPDSKLHRLLQPPSVTMLRDGETGKVGVEGGGVVVFLTVVVLPKRASTLN